MGVLARTRSRSQNISNKVHPGGCEKKVMKEGNEEEEEWRKRNPALHEDRLGGIQL